ncbi:carotenoid biosynthesis protein [uncultured Pseudokineococcus sp.]|uniref:carotenoid biosynthesis protein n=1 Tax=uncultured Pseudokineococcus sp. TaxID=1642928 RepID=UPI0026050B2E|nr:carotenoid biosynthesis protein [uncultured Pseudokineococcus sp.]
MVTTEPSPPPRAATARRRSPLAVASLLLAVLAVLAQVAHPLLSGDALHTTTVAAVALFAAAVLADAARRFGPATAGGVLLVAGGIGLLAEAVGTATGFPFGAYSYAGSLGPQVLDVPVVVPLAWTMMAYPMLLAGRTLAPPGSWTAVPVAAVGLASWDLFLDPMMVAQGHWTWADPTPALPGVPGIPLTNYAGWLLVALVISAVLQRVVPDPRRPPRKGRSAGARGPAARRAPAPGTDRARGSAELAVPGLLLGWTWLGSTVDALVFSGRPWVALWGFVVMGAVVAPTLAHWLWAAASMRRR